MQKKEKNPHGFYQQLKSHFVKILLSASFIPLILIGGISYYHFYFTFKSNTLRYLENLVRDRQNQIDIFLSERLSNLKTVSKGYSLDYLLENKNLSRVFAIYQKEYGTFTELGIIDAQGKHLSYVGPY